MTVAFIVGDSNARLWGLSSRERIARQLRSIGGIAPALEPDSIPETGRVLILRADYAYDLRTLTGLLEHDGLLTHGAEPAAAHVDGAHAAAALELLRAAIASGAGRAAPATSAAEAPPAADAAPRSQPPPSPPPPSPPPDDTAPPHTSNEGAGSRETAASHPAGDAERPGRVDAPANPTEEAPVSIPAVEVGALDAFEADLRKTEPPLLEPLSTATAKALEDRLYGISYKGITDFVTKWWWPVPAKSMVRVCAHTGITPNAVTGAGLVLMLATCWLFHEGFYFWGLLLGWCMTYLDTVDGKLARVTVQSSRFGHWLDHGMDILHPPFWYWLWGLSLAGFEPRLGFGFETLMIFIVAGYVGGRVIEGAFHGLGSVSLFAWRPFDAWFRLFTARRNPCLLLLTAGWLVGEPGLGFELVALWTLISSIVLLGRLVFACCTRMTSGPLTSWLADGEAERRYPGSFRTFSSTRRAYD